MTEGEGDEFKGAVFVCISYEHLQGLDEHCTSFSWSKRNIGTLLLTTLL